MVVNRVLVLGFCVLVLAAPSLAVLAQQMKPIAVQIRDLEGYANTPNLVSVEGVTGEIQNLNESIRVYALAKRFPNDDKDTIWVKTSRGRPDSDLTYRVIGTVVKEGEKLFLLEQKRTRSEQPPAAKGDGGKQEPPDKTRSGGKSKSKVPVPTLVGIALIGLAVVLAVVTGVSIRNHNIRQKAALERQREALEREKELIRKGAQQEKKANDGTIASGARPENKKPKGGVTVEAWGRLQVKSGPHSGLTAPLSGRQITIGREEGDLQLPQDTTVSSKHGKIVATNDGRLLFVDDSRNGSIVDGTPVHHSQVDLAPNSVIEVGESRIEVVCAGLAGVASPAQSSHSGSVDAETPSAGSKVTMVGDMRPDSPAENGGPPEAELVVVSGPDGGKRFQIRKDKTTVGRREDQDIVLTDDFVSRQHGECAKQGDKWTWRNISDKGSMVNGERHSEAVIKNGDRIAIGSTVLEFCIASQEPSRSTPTMYDA